MTADDGRGRGRGMNPWRIARWSVAAIILLLPAVAMQFTEEVNWSFGDYIFATVLLGGSLGAYELATKMTGNGAYRAGFGVGILAAFLLVWVNGAVGITDSGVDPLFVLLVPPIGILGAIIARFRPAGMARAMFVTAMAPATVGLVALLAGAVPPYNEPFEVLAITGFFALMFVVSALLFQQAARAGVKTDAT